MHFKRILLVEDNPDHEELALMTLSEGGITGDVAVVRDGAEALDYLFARNSHAGRDPADTPDIILLDLKLPKIDGLEVLQTIRVHEATRAIPVVVLTSSGEESDIVRSYRLGANSYVRKPIIFDQFVERLRQIQMYWLLINETPRIRWT